MLAIGKYQATPFPQDGPAWQQHAGEMEGRDWPRARSPPLNAHVCHGCPPKPEPPEGPNWLAGWLADLGSLLGADRSGDFSALRMKTLESFGGVLEVCEEATYKGPRPTKKKFPFLYHGQPCPPRGPASSGAPSECILFHLGSIIVDPELLWSA